MFLWEADQDSVFQVMSQNSVNEWWKKVQRSPVLTTREEGLTLKIEINEGPLHLFQILRILGRG